MNQPSLQRDAVGFLIGGLTGAIASGLAFLIFFPLPPLTPTDHTRQALAVLTITMFFCGGFIGRRAFSADFWSDLLPSVTTSYVIIVFFCFTSGLDFGEAAPLIGLASIGIVTSVIALLVLGSRFPQQTETPDS